MNNVILRKSEIPNLVSSVRYREMSYTLLSMERWFGVMY